MVSEITNYDVVSEVTHSYNTQFINGALAVARFNTFNLQLKPFKVAVKILTNQSCPMTELVRFKTG